ncbi:hypothetical protein NC651_013981 [Populus alba x Populus x berolinensis]|nr:hypothetical protein NC651_013981 [Populus alba x Populus x berolinensis]
MQINFLFLNVKCKFPEFVHNPKVVGYAESIPNEQYKNNINKGPLNGNGENLELATTRLQMSIQFCLIPADYAFMVHHMLARKIDQMILEDYQFTGDNQTIFVWKSIGLVLKYGTLPSLRSLVDGSVP